MRVRISIGVCACVRAFISLCVRVCLCIRACMRQCVCVYMRASVHVHAIVVFKSFPRGKSSAITPRNPCLDCIEPFCLLYSQFLAPADYLNNLVRGTAMNCSGIFDVRVPIAREASIAAVCHGISCSSWKFMYSEHEIGS